MTVNDSWAPEPVPPIDLLGLRNIVGDMFDQMDYALGELCLAVKQHGADQVRAALGDGADSVMAICEALSEVAVTGNPYAVEEQLPSRL